MHPFTVLFIALVAAGLALREWLLWRQIRAVRAGRERVPPPFATSITAVQHARAADYTIALARAAMAQAAVSAAILLLITVGGGIAALDTWIAGSGFSAVPHGVAVITATALALTVCGLPFDVWRTFGIEARFGFNRTTPALFAVDLLKGLAISAVLLLPLVAAMLWSIPALGDRWWLWAWGGWALFSFLLSWAWPRLSSPSSSS